MAEERHKTFTKRRIALCAAVVLFAAVIGLLVANHDSTPLPVYQGKTAREWLYEYGATSQTKGGEAFKQMGSNAVPFLVQELSRNDSFRERSALWLYPKLPASIRSHLRMPLGESTRWETAAMGLEMANSRAAIPGLTNLLADAEPEQQSLALVQLSHLLGRKDTNCIPALTNCLSSKDISVCIGAAVSLQQMNAENLAIPALSNFISSANWQERVYCLEALRCLDSANTNKWSRILTNDPDWIAEQRAAQHQ